MNKIYDVSFYETRVNWVLAKVEASSPEEAFELASRGETISGTERTENSDITRRDDVSVSPEPIIAPYVILQTIP